MSREDVSDRWRWAVGNGRGIGQSTNGTEAPEMDDSAERLSDAFPESWEY